MNKLSKIKLSFIGINTLCFFYINAQVSTPTNANVLNNPNFYVGWNSLVTVPVRIEHQGNQPILFGTNGSIRMKIDNGLAGPNNGRIAMGNNLPANFAPAGRLHIHQTASVFQNNEPYVRFTTNTTGALATDGFIIGNVTNQIGQILGDVYLGNYEARTHISIQTDNSGTTAGGVLYERVRFNADDRNGFVGIGNSGAFNASSQVHINTLGITGGLLGAAAYGNLFRTDGDQTLDNKWQLFNGTTVANSTEKGVLFTSNATISQTGQPSYNHFVMQSTLGDLAFLSRGLTAAVGEVGRFTRVTSSFYNQNEGRLSVGRLGSIPKPLAMLHMGDGGSGSPAASGYRTWMDIGTYAHYSIDNTYLGMKTINTNNNEVIMNVGTGFNAASFPPIPRMRFIFTAPGSITSFSTAATTDGLQGAHFITVDGLNPRMGIGDFQTQGVAAGIPDPSNTVEIMASSSSPYWNYPIVNTSTISTTSASGLRFSFLTANSTVIPILNTFGVNTNKALSVDAGGNVVLIGVNAGGTGGGTPVCGKNGLNCTFGAPDIELGGFMYHNTDVDQRDFNLVWNNLGGTNNNGVFGIGENLSSATIGAQGARVVFNSSKFISTLNVNNAISAPSGQNVYGGNFFCLGTGGAAGTANVGLAATAANHPSNNTGIVSVVGTQSGTNVGVQTFVQNAVINKGVFISSVGNSGVTSLNTGIESNVNRGVSVYSGRFNATCDVSTTIGCGILATMENLNGNSTSLISSVAIAGEVADEVSTRSKYGVLGLTRYGNIGYGNCFPNNGLSGNGNIAVAGIVGGNGLTTPNVLFLGTPIDIAVYGGFANAAGTCFNSAFPNAWAGYFDGNVNVNGTAYYNGVTPITSDQMFKTHVDSITNPIGKLMQLNPITFYYDTLNPYGINFSSSLQIGFKAQDVQNVIPQLVGSFTKPAVYDTSGTIIHQQITYKTLNYNAFIGFYAAVLQKMQAHAEKQDSVIHEMASVVNACCSSNIIARSDNNSIGFEKNVQEIKLTLPLSISISEARPNPNSGKAEIDYYIPSTIANVKIVFTDMMGRIISETKLTAGYGTLAIDTKELPSGIYNYTLIADEKVIDTKKMIKQQ